MNKKKSNILWGISVFFLLSSWTISVLQPNFIFDTLDTEKIENTLQVIIDKAESENHFEYSNSPKSYELVIQESDSLIYWSTNKLDFKKLQNIDTTGIYNLSSRIYLAWTKVVNTQKLYFLVPLKRDFDFENDFLQNSSFEYNEFPKNYKPTSEKGKHKIALLINNNDFDFYFESTHADEFSNYWTNLIFLVFISALIILSFLSFRAILLIENLANYWKIIIWILLVLVVRFLFISQLPFIEQFYLFQPFDFANSYISSIGMLIINVSLVYILVYYFLKLWRKANPTFNFLQSLFLQIILLGFLIILVAIFKNIIYNSTSNFVDLETVILRYQEILILLVFGTLLLTAAKTLQFILNHTVKIDIYLFGKFATILYLPAIILSLIFDWHFIVLPLYIILSGLIISLKPNIYFSKQTIRLLLIFLGSLFIVCVIEYFSSKKELDDSYLRLENYQVENNRLAEYLIQELDDKLIQDSSLLSLIYQLPATQQKIYDYIKAQYATGFWSGYESEITVCGNIFDAPNDISSCDSFFNPKLLSVIKRIPNTHFSVNQDYGVNNYIGKFAFEITRDSSLIDLYILLKPKEENKNLGYPSILLSKEVDSNEDQNYFSFAKYVNNQLISHSGDYNYETIYSPKKTSKNGIYWENNYRHLVEKQTDQIMNVISVKEKSIWTYFVILSYIFILYILSFYLFDGINSIIHNKISFQNSLKDKLRISYLALLAVTFSVISWAIIYKSTELSTKKQEAVLEEKMQSVLVELKHKLSEVKNIEDMSKEYLDYLLTKFSNVFFTDINLYNLSGELVASSRLEVFEKGLVGNKMNSQAFKSIVEQHQISYIHNEKIGKQSYLSAYIPFKTPKNEIIAYLNLPYFAKNKEIQSDITSLVTAFLNIFVIFFLITGFFAIFISNRITLPLAIIQKKLKGFSIGKKNEKIVYNSKDEIGALVSQYNTTVEELNKNIELLAHKEREGAWKEMAKQIAHEIKNPLTPMKLSIQHLKYVWKDDKPDKDKKINETVDLIVKQIDNLAEIASAFSNFSRMTVAQKSEFDLIKLINELVLLHSEKVQIKLIYDTRKSFIIHADEQQISRVFQNLITNAIQAIPENRTGKIKIYITENQKEIISVIEDNGIGMNEEIQKLLFKPNFTTKNSGMGLGLAIVKQIIKNNSGQISFETEENIGSSFKLVFPKQ